MYLNKFGVNDDLLSLENHINSQQKSICTKHGAPYTAIPLDNLIGVAIDTFKPGNWPINGLRHPLEAGQSVGWYIWAGENFSESADFFKPMHILHLVEFCPLLLPYLGLSPGWRFLLADGYEDVWYDGSLLNI
jgi:hypothetical protein